MQRLAIILSASLLFWIAGNAAVQGFINPVVGTPQTSSSADGLRIVVIEGDDAVNIIQQRTAVAPVVEVRDRNDQPVAGVVLNFAIRSGRASFNGARTLTLTTDAAGRAAVTGLTPLQSGAYQLDVIATYQGQTATTTVIQTNFKTVSDAAKAGRQVSPEQGAGVAGGSAGAVTVASGEGVSKLAVLGVVGAGAAGAAVAGTMLLSNTAPVVGAVTASVSATLMTLPVTFSSQASDRNDDPLTYAWDFGDGTASTEPSPTHVYVSAGSFTAHLSVSDGKKSADAQTTVVVRSLTGTWRSGTVNSSLGPTDLVFAFTQSGSSVTGAISLSFPTASFPNCQITGSVGATSPRVVIQQLPCPGLVQGQPGTFNPATFTFDPGPDANTLAGTLNSQSITLTRQ